MFSGIQDPETWVALISLCAMEIVLGIDNVVFISILTARLPPDKRDGVGRMGLLLALVMRIGLLFTISFLMGLTRPLFTLPVVGAAISGKSLILLIGGLFLMGKSTNEIYAKVEQDEEEAHGSGGKAVSVGLVIAQILALDIVFSLDSVITAVGMIPPEQMWVMVTAVMVSVGVMLVFAKGISGFVLAHPSVKLLALAFLLLIGVMLVAEGMGQKIPKGYIYFAMAFALGVELLNMRFRKKRRKNAPEAAPAASPGAAP
ncbi:TerC family protein [Polyangium mundeleinium]|uniref:TerC family protein n=1 Tax=Polyangium mundeleinium TaxID=2995306 RepID=A0ABT5EQD2_9BACT|nr:TerC family protein [Polyangium mundeleinium]MDC0743549.1 TerC family protein [Polyangium mundeleinium]